MLCELDFYIKTHEKLLLSLFPGIRLINKHHYIHHYVKMIREKGPPLHYCCLWFESKHANIKNQVKVSRNFINLPYSITKKAAFKQSLDISQQKFEQKKFEILSKKKISVNLCSSKAYLREIYNINDLSEISQIKVLKLNNVILKNNYFLPFIEDDEVFPSFIRVDEMIVVQSRYYLYGPSFKSKSFDENLNAYEIEKGSEIKFFDLMFFSFFKPVSIWHTQNNTEIDYIHRKEYY